MEEMPMPPEDRLLQEQLGEIQRQMDHDENCSKGPLIEKAIEKIDEHIDESKEFRSEFRESQKELTAAVVGLAATSEKLVGIATQTEHNHNELERVRGNVQTLFNYNRETEHKLNTHLIEDHSYKKQEASQPGQPDSMTVVKANRFDKLTWMGIAAASTWFVTLAYNGLMTLIEALQTLGG
jgi:DNA repair ATPase RecN